MKVVILAGGRGTRLSEEVVTRPKPMVEIGGRPMLWHVMSIYACHGYKDFVVACGYHGHVIKEYFRNFAAHDGDAWVDLGSGTITELGRRRVDWNVGLVDTGVETQTGGRILRLRQWLGDEAFMVTYGDGVGDIDIAALARFHRSHGKLATVTGVRPPARFGALVLDGHRVREFSEKTQAGEGWINGGFFVFEPGVFDYLGGDQTALEHEPMERLARDGQLMAWLHEGFWHPMDTLRDKQLLDSLWQSASPPWKIWR